MAEHKKYYFISSLKKGMDVLELLAEHSELSVSQTAKTLGYNRAGAHRFLATLKELGYVDQNKKGHYELTFKILELSTKLASRFEIRKTAMRFMQELSKKYTETINLGFLEGVDVVHLEKINSPEILRIDSEIGSRAPAQHTALGKAILAFLPESDLDTFWSQAKRHSSTSKSIVSREMLQRELQQIKARGYALDNEEL
ncbi:MAG: IclR family transcriptional regulator, partial [Desulfohalobiaceae bacterium]|nr:IclR family transcriptional regulator [Desulfohalobiaceae bacterium]